MATRIKERLIIIAMIAMLFSIALPLSLFSQTFRPLSAQSPSYTRQTTTKNSAKSSVGEKFRKPFSVIKKIPAEFRRSKPNKSSSTIKRTSENYGNQSRSKTDRLDIFSKFLFSRTQNASSKLSKPQKENIGKAIYAKKIDDPSVSNTLVNYLKSPETNSGRYSTAKSRAFSNVPADQPLKPLESTLNREESTSTIRPRRLTKIPHPKMRPQFQPQTVNRGEYQRKYNSHIRLVGAEENQIIKPPAPASVPEQEDSAAEQIPDEQRRLTLPLSKISVTDNVKYSSQNGKISLVVRDAPINSVLGMIAQQNGLNIVASSDVTGQVTVTLTNVRLDAALNAILEVNGYTWNLSNDILLVSQLSSESKTSPLAQGKQVQVFPLNFVSASEVDVVVKGLLSPIGHSFISETDTTNKLKTREQIVVEDLPKYLSRIEQYILQIDQPPQQVYIEAHVLQVTLKDENRHGVNFTELLRLANSRAILRTAGFANPLASPSFSLGLNGTDLKLLVDLLQTTTDAKTLASPKVFVVNGQEARIQVGQQLGYLVTTTTQTSTLQEVNFLDLGVVLRVTPQITNSNQVLMSVKPEVSNGRINPDTGLPEEDTTEVQTTIMLADGQGMIIGGLIKEIDIDTQSKIPFLGDIWLLGKLFQKHQITRERNEIIIALIPRIVPNVPACLCEDEMKLQQATTPLFYGPLHRNFRPWEPRLASSFENPRHFQFRSHNLKWRRPDEYPRPPEYYFPSVYERRTQLFDGELEVEPLYPSSEEEYYPPPQPVEAEETYYAE